MWWRRIDCRYQTYHCTNIIFLKLPQKYALYYTRYVLTNWHKLQKCCLNAGFRTSSAIFLSSENETDFPPSALDITKHSFFCLWSSTLQDLPGLIKPSNVNFRRFVRPNWNLCHRQLSFRAGEMKFPAFYFHDEAIRQYCVSTADLLNFQLAQKSLLIFV